MKKVGFALVFTAGLALLAAACAPAAAPPAVEKKEAAPAAKEKPQYGGVFRQVYSNPRIGQDPHRTTGSSYFGNYGMALSALLGYEMKPDTSAGTFIFAPYLAERWESPTPTTWVFYLRKGVKWHNILPVKGREFVADDVVYSINRMKAPGGSHSGNWQDVEKVEALDRYTVRFTLKQPSAAFLSHIAYDYHKMVAKEAVEAGGGTLDKGPTIGTGPWLVECMVDVECVFKRNPDHFLKDEDGNQLPFIEKRINLVIPDVQAVFAAFRARQLDIYSLTAEERQLVERAHPEVIITNVPGFSSGNQFHFRNDRAPWNDERVRTAVSKAIDRQEIIDTLYGGKGWFHLGWANPAEDWYLPQEEFREAYKRDVPLAKKLLAEAGFPNGLDASLWCANYGAVDIPRCELLAAQMAAAGIRVKINVHDRPVYLTKVYTRHGVFDDMANGPQGAFREPDLWLSSYYHSQGGLNMSYTNDPKLDQMIEAQRRELDSEKRKKLVHEIQRYLLQKNFNLVILAGISQNAHWPWLKNRSFAGDERSLEYLWIDQELKKKLGAPE